MSPAQHSSDVANPVVKVASAWALFSITSWGDLAAVLAALYSALLIAEWVWKKLLRPCAERRGWLRRPDYKRRKGEV